MTDVIRVVHRNQITGMSREILTENFTGDSAEGFCLAISGYPWLDQWKSCLYYSQQAEYLVGRSYIFDCQWEMLV